jgi:hypothetical protein
VVRWRRVDLARVIKSRFNVTLAERSVGAMLRRLGFRRLSEIGSWLPVALVTVERWQWALLQLMQRREKFEVAKQSEDLSPALTELRARPAPPGP